MIIKVDSMSNKLLERQPPKFAKGHELELNLKLVSWWTKIKNIITFYVCLRWWSLLPSHHFGWIFNTTSSSSGLNMEINPNKVGTNLDSEPVGSTNPTLKTKMV